MMRKGTVRKGIAAIVTAVTVFVSASTILAYEPFKSVNDKAIEVSDLGQFGSFSAIGGSNEESIFDYDFSVSDEIFIYEDGTQVPITSQNLPYAFCNHIMVSGYYSVHSSNSSGGCTVYVYNAKECSKCGYLEVGDLYNVITYKVCPHL